MTPRSCLGYAYRLLERTVLTRLPSRAQRTVTLTLLAVFKHLLPPARWLSLEYTLLARRQLRHPPNPKDTLPSWALSDMRDLALHVDPLLSPEAFLAYAPVAVLTPTHWVQAGQTYQRICNRLATREFDTILLVPWLKQGGADLGAIHHARLCKEVLGQRTLVMATEQGDSPWANRLPNDVAFMHIGTDLSGLNKEMSEAEVVLARLLIQLDPARIHLINSHLGWRTIQKFGLAIRQRSRVFASLYCDERDATGAKIGLAQDHLPTSWRWLDGVITDNSVSPLEWIDTMAIRPDLFHVVHFPSPAVRPVSPPGQPAAQRRLLWASRFELQKRPDLLVELAALLKDFHWDVYGEPLTKADKYYRALQGMDNVTLHGKYESFLDIVRPDHLAFVYTTAWDGLPNVLLEAAAAGLPIVAPDIGGIRDLLPSRFLLPARAGVHEYALAIRALHVPACRESHLFGQQARLEMFTWERFANHMTAIDGYSTPRTL